MGRALALSATPDRTPDCRPCGRKTGSRIDSANRGSIPQITQTHRDARVGGRWAISIGTRPTAASIDISTKDGHAVAGANPRHFHTPHRMRPARRPPQTAEAKHRICRRNPGLRCIRRTNSPEARRRVFRTGAASTFRLVHRLGRAGRTRVADTLVAQAHQATQRFRRPDRRDRRPKRQNRDEESSWLHDYRLAQKRTRPTGPADIAPTPIIYTLLASLT